MFGMGLGNLGCRPGGAGEAPSSLLTGILSYWALTADANDAVGGRNMTNNGSVTFGADGATFSGANYLSRAAGELGYSSAVSWSYWIDQDSADNDKTALQAGNNGGTRINFLKAESNYQYLGGATGNDYHNAGGATPSTSNKHYVITIDGTTLHVYQNGVDGGAVTIDEAMAADASRILLFGAYSNGAATANLAGKLAHIGCWLRALTGAEVTELYNGGTPNPYPF